MRAKSVTRPRGRRRRSRTVLLLLAHLLSNVRKQFKRSCVTNGPTVARLAVLLQVRHWTKALSHPLALVLLAAVPSARSDVQEGMRKKNGPKFSVPPPSCPPRQPPLLPPLLPPPSLLPPPPFYIGTQHVRESFGRAGSVGGAAAASAAWIRSGKSRVGTGATGHFKIMILDQNMATLDSGTLTMPTKSDQGSEIL